MADLVKHIIDPSKNSKPIGRRTAEDKEFLWNKVIDGRLALYRRWFKTVKYNKEVFKKFTVLEFEGGHCFLCHKLWKEQLFDNHFLTGRYFIPNCDCFVRCPSCDSELYDLQYVYNQKLKYCDNCNWLLLDPDAPTWKKRYGKDFELYFLGLSPKIKAQMKAER